jgi:hypothetical protein
MYYPLFEYIFLLRHISIQSNYLQAIYIRFYENYDTYNGSLFLGLINFLYY